MKPDRRPPVITLTTDFGLTDHYVGTMKGVILSRCPDAKIADISHEIPPFSIYAGAYAIAQAAPFFPPGTVHAVVVDPGVGTARRAVLVQANEQHFIAPDNGVLSLIVLRDQGARKWEISNESLWLKPRSHTFHGRDIFAPVAAALADNSVKSDNVGPQIEHIAMLEDLLPAETEPSLWRGRIFSIDHFGNVITNFRSRDFPQVGRGVFTLSIGNCEITEYRTTFGEASGNNCFVYSGSSGYLEIGINQDSATARLGVRPGDPALLRVKISE